MLLLKSLDRIQLSQHSEYHNQISREINRLQQLLEQDQKDIKDKEAQLRSTAVISSYGIEKDNKIEKQLDILYIKMQNHKNKIIELKRQQNQTPQKFVIGAQKLLFELQYHYNISFTLLKGINIQLFECFDDIQKRKLAQLIQVVLIFNTINIIQPNNTNSVNFINSIPQDAIADIDVYKFQKLIQQLDELFATNQKISEEQIRKTIQSATEEWSTKYEQQILQQFTQTVVQTNEMNKGKQNNDEIRRWLKSDEQSILKSIQTILQNIKWVYDVKLQTTPFKLLYKLNSQPKKIQDPNQNYNQVEQQINQKNQVNQKQIIHITQRYASTINFHSTSFSYLMEMICKAYKHVTFIETSNQSAFRTQLHLLQNRDKNFEIQIPEIETQQLDNQPTIQLVSQASDLSKFQPIFSLQNYLNYFKLINNQNLECQDAVVAIFQSFASLQYAMKTLYLQPNKNQFFNNKLIMTLTKETLVDIYKTIDNGKGCIVFAYMDQPELPILIGSGIKTVIFCGLPAKGIASFQIENDLFNCYMANNSYTMGLKQTYKRQKELIIGNIIKIINLMCLRGNIKEKTLFIADRRFYVVNGEVFICENENNLSDMESIALRIAQQHQDQSKLEEVWRGIKIKLDNSQYKNTQGKTFK